MRHDEMGANPAPGFKEHPEYRIGIEGIPKRIRAAFGGGVVADSTGAVLMRETGHLPVYYFPRRDVRRDLLARTKHSSNSPFKGPAAYWTLRADGRTAENAARIGGYYCFDIAKSDSIHVDGKKIEPSPPGPRHPAPERGLPGGQSCRPAR